MMDPVRDRTKRVPGRWMFAIFAVFSFGVLGIAILNPSPNWDIVGYIAAAKSIESNNAAGVHHFTYSILRNSMPAKDFLAIVPNEKGFKTQLAADPAALREQVRLYRIRVLTSG